MQATTVGLDLAKNIFQVHRVTENGEVVSNQDLRRAQLFAFFEKLRSCLVGMEACGSSHHWLCTWSSRNLIFQHRTYRRP